MMNRFTSYVHSFVLSISIAMGGFAICAAPAEAADIPVENEDEYIILIDAIRAAEYTRQQYLEANANPRAIATIAGLSVFAERNPLATPDQLTAFATAFDAALTTAVDGDPTLIRFGSLATALNSTRIASDAVLVGMDTRVGPRAMELLGLDLPGLRGYEQSRQRMARFDLSAVRALIHRSETADALTTVLAGVDPSGARVSGLALAGAAYLESVGYSPMLGMVDPSQAFVNAGLVGLPTYAEFVTIRDVDGAHLALEQSIFGSIDLIQFQAGVTLTRIGTAEASPNLALDSIDLYQAAANPNDPNHDAAVDDLENRRMAIIDAIRLNSDERAAIFASTLLLQQSNYPQVEQIATVTRSFAGLQLQTNNDLAIAEQSVNIVGANLGVLAAFAEGDLWGGVQSVTDIVSSTIVLTDTLGGGTPSAEEQIFGQIIELRQQVEDLRVQMNDRFDVVDEKLDSIFGTMLVGFQALGDQIGDLQDDVNDLSASIAQTRTTLERIEAALFGFAEDVLLFDLSVQTNLVLDYRQSAGLDLPYGASSPNYVESSSFFHTFATTTSKSTTFAGPTTQTLTLENALDTLSVQPIARSINDLRRIPTGLFTFDAVPVVGPITSARVAAPAPWAQAAASYAQFARENPWYFAYLLANQQDNPGATPDIDEIINDGQRINTLAAATRGRFDLWEGLLERAIGDTEPLEIEAEFIIENELIPRGLSNGVVQVNPWSPPIQDILPVAPVITTVTVQGGDQDKEFSVSSVTNGMASRGYEITIADDRGTQNEIYSREELARLNAMIALILPSPSGSNYNFSIDVLPAPGQFNLLFRDSSTGFAVRELRIQVESSINGPWEAWPLIETSDFYRERILAANPVLITAELESGNVVNRTLNSGIYVIGPTQFPTRIRFIGDSNLFISLDSTIAQISDAFGALRTTLRGAVLDGLQSPGSQIAQVGQRLDNTSALFDGYLTLGAADAMTRSEALRSAFRSVPGISGLGFRPADVAAMITYADFTDDISNGVEPAEYDVTNIRQFLADRLLAIADELAPVLEGDAPSFPYVEFVLAELRELRDNAYRLAIDDTYAASGPISVAAPEGLMANDIGQPGRIDTQDLMVDMDFLSAAEYTPPANGTVSVASDGSFTYTPSPGFEGTDSFNYRLIALVDDSPNPVGDPNVRSEPATVVLLVSASPCPADLTGDGVLNFFDVSAFLVAYTAMEPTADLTGDGVFNFFDVSAFLSAYNAGCP